MLSSSRPSTKRYARSSPGLFRALDLVSTPVHRVDLFEVVSSLPEVVERSTRGVIDGVVVLLSELTNERVITSDD